MIERPSNAPLASPRSEEENDIQLTSVNLHQQQQQQVASFQQNQDVQQPTSILVHHQPQQQQLQITPQQGLTPSPRQHPTHPTLAPSVSFAETVVHIPAPSPQASLSPLSQQQQQRSSPRPSQLRSNTSFPPPSPLFASQPAPSSFPPAPSQSDPPVVPPGVPRMSEGGRTSTNEAPLETALSTSSINEQTLRNASIFSTYLPNVQPQEKKITIMEKNIFRRPFSFGQTLSKRKLSFIDDENYDRENLLSNDYNKFIITPQEMAGELPRSPHASRIHAERAIAHRYSVRPTMSKVLDKEAELKKESSGKKTNCKLFLYQVQLAYGALGIVFGDVGTSPLYTFSSIFEHEPVREDVLGALSLIIWTILIIVALKYVTLMLLANDRGEGGPFALFSLLSRNLKKKFANTKKLSWVMYLFEVMACVGVACVLSDGVLTPSISVLGAVAGIEVAAEVSQSVVVGVSIAIVLLLFLIQQMGTARVSYFFSPLMSLWFASLFSIGVYNITYVPEVLTSFNPAVGFQFFFRHGYEGWVSLGAVFLCVTGAEATFADMGHFTGTAIRLSALCIVVPSLLACYCGQAARLIMEPALIENTFFHTIPTPVFYPMLVLAFCAAVTSSQAIISATFSLISQAIQLDMFPKLTLKHTDPKHIGQVYVPEINYFYMVVVVCVIAAYQSATALGNAYGIAVAAAMFIDTFFYSCIIFVAFDRHWIFSLLFFCCFALVDVSFLSSNLLKFPLGGWFAVTLTLLTSSVLLVWHWGRRRMVGTRRSTFTENFDTFFRQDNEAMKTLSVLKHGVCICYSSSADCVAPAYLHYLSCMPCLPRYTIFVHIRSVRQAFVQRDIVVETVPCDNPDLKVYRCIIDNGYKQESPNAEFLAQAIVRRLDKGSTHFFLVSQDHVSAPPDSNLLHRFFVRCFELLLGISRTELKALDFPPERCLEIGIMIPISPKEEETFTA